METATGELTPWEQRDRLGLGPGLFDTLRQSAFSPGKLFAALRPDVPWTEAFWYGWLLQSLFGAVGAVLFLLQTFWAAAPTPLRLLGLLIVPLAPVVLYPAIVLVLGVVVHLLALLLRAAHRGLGATLRAVCYSGVSVGLLLSVSPLGLWGLVVGVFALAGLQGTTHARAAIVLVAAELLLGAAFIIPLGIYLAHHLP